MYYHHLAISGNTASQNIFNSITRVCSVFSIYWQHNAVFTTNPHVEYYCHIILPGTCRKGCAGRWTIMMKNSLYDLKFPSVNVSQFERILSILLWVENHNGQSICYYFDLQFWHCSFFQSRRLQTFILKLTSPCIKLWTNRTAATVNTH